jgi:hypothetical protein
MAVFIAARADAARWLSSGGGRRYDGLVMAERVEMAEMAETLKCPICGAENESAARNCGKCQCYLNSELECLRSIDRSVGIMKRILIWWLVVSFLGAVAYISFRFPRN